MHVVERHLRRITYLITFLRCSWDGPGMDSQIQLPQSPPSAARIAHPLPLPVGLGFYRSVDMEFNDGRARNPGWLGLGIANSITRAMGFSSLSSFLSESLGNTNLFDALRLFVAGTIIETGRRFCRWAFERFKIRQFPVLFIYGVLF
jgi:hypothetical protein